MRLSNPRRANSFRAAVDDFSNGNSWASFRNVRSVTSFFYKWLATTRFKVRGNTQTNPNKAFINFFTDRDMLLNRYGNIFSVNDNIFFKNNPRPQFASRSYELSTNQYRVVGQEYTEFDIIRYMDVSGSLDLDLAHVQQEFTIFHDAGDAPVFVAAGYSIYNPTTGKTYYVIENEPVSVQILFDTFIIILNDDEKDIRTNKEFLAALYAQPSYLGIEGWFEGANVYGSGDIILPEILNDPTQTKLFYHGYAVSQGGSSPNMVIEYETGDNNFSAIDVGYEIFIDPAGNGNYVSYTVTAFNNDNNIEVSGSPALIDTQVYQYFYRSPQ